MIICNVVRRRKNITINCIVLLFVVLLSWSQICFSYKITQTFSASKNNHMSQHFKTRYSIFDNDSDNETDESLTGIGTLLDIVFDQSVDNQSTKESSTINNNSYGIILLGEATDIRRQDSAQIHFKLSDFCDDLKYLLRGYEVQFQYDNSSSDSIVVKSVSLSNKMKSLLLSSNNNLVTNTSSPIQFVNNSNNITSASTLATKFNQNNNNHANKITRESNSNSNNDNDTNDTNDDWSQYRPLSGIQANINWRSVPLEDLRHHPLYTSLPDTHDIHVSSTQDLTLFRQDSWQWDVLHRGRLTTSRAAACLGFYEEHSSKVLGIPKSLIGHNRVLDAWNQLQLEPVSDYSILNIKEVSSLSSTHADISNETDDMVIEENTPRSSSASVTATITNTISNNNNIWRINKLFHYKSSSSSNTILRASNNSNNSSDDLIKTPSSNSSSTIITATLAILTPPTVATFTNAATTTTPSAIPHNITSKSKNNDKFHYTYHPRKYSLEQSRYTCNSVMSARLAWGGAQVCI